MHLIQSFSRKSLIWIVIYLILLMILPAVGVYMGTDILSGAVRSIGAGEDPAQVQTAAAKLSDLVVLVRQLYIPVLGGLVLIFSLLLWSTLRAVLGGLVRSAGAPARERETPAKRPEAEDQAERTRRAKLDKRLFLHMMSVLQREGRLVDFFSEKLDDYSDEDIGMAVRSIHEQCNTALKKYLAFEPILDAEEETETVVEAGFDPNAVKLTGNVTGEPPFTGVVRHKGWKAVSLNMPALSGDRPPEILSPAEVEVL